MPESELFFEIASLRTERKNPASENIDIMTTREILLLINEQDSAVAAAVRQELPQIERAVDKITEAFKSGGRLFYFGAGTSGRLGIIDAAECPPTFGSPPEMVQGVIAGGKEAVFKAQEGAEDLPENGAKEVIERNIMPPDIICGIAASGRTPFVKGALAEGRRRRVPTILISTVSREEIEKIGIVADILICPDVGPEVITGSTRMKSGTAQKLVLNMLTTASMVRLGKTLGNVMVDLQLTNAKLHERAKRILMEITGITYDEAVEFLNRSGGHVKTALVMVLADVSAEDARKKLDLSGGFVRKAIQE
ncbi:MAG: N-acetylmuramic acid 6-phosphate etherase [Bacteroidota bacterium]|nr:N-acetylmuramic acid 6-phosphate etherase [Bacteroidota bacterium]